MQDRNFGLNLELNSGHPCLEFTNTVSNHASEQPGEKLFSYEDVLAWAKRVELLSSEDADRLAQRAKRQTERVSRILAKSVELREVIYRIFVAKTQGKPPLKEDLTVLNSTLSYLTQGVQLMPHADRFEWQWNFDENALEAPLWLIALSAVDLMTSEYYARLGQCADEDGCGWLFVDTSKNHSRRWCDINDCGNRAKQRRYQKRTQKQKS